jgi:hypothetical protein
MELFTFTKLKNPFHATELFRVLLCTLLMATYQKRTNGLACISAIPGPISVIIIFSFENHVICFFLLKVAFTFTSEFDLISLSNPVVNSALASRTGRKKAAIQKLAVAVC